MSQTEERYTRIAHHLQALIDETNSMTLDNDAAAEAMLNVLTQEHRTLQQSFFRILAKAVERYGEFGRQYHDLRNEASIAWCQKAADATKDTYFPYI